MLHPTPVGSMHETKPGRNAERARQVCDGGVRGEQQIDRGQDRRRVEEGSGPRVEVLEALDRTLRINRVQLILAGPFLQR